MTNILVECPQKIASVQVGVLEPLRPLEEAGTCEVHYQDTAKVTPADIAWCDVFICVRGCEYPTLHLVQAAKNAGCFLIYFLDDDLLEIPEEIHSTNYFRDNKIKMYLTRILELCDVLWAVNKEIIYKYKKFVSRTILLRVPAKILRQPPSCTGILHVLYAGSKDHSKLVQEILVPAVKKILEEYPGLVDFTFIGADPNLKHIKGVRWYSYFENYEEYHKIVLSGEFSVGLAPVYNTSFYSCKYYNKFIEYSSCGIAGIYSDSEPYRQIIQTGKNGILCHNDTNSWYQAISNLVETPQRAREIAQQASELLKVQFNHATIGQSLQSQIPEIVSYHAPAILKENIRLKSMKRLFYQERILFLCRTYGFFAPLIIALKAMKKVWKYIWKRKGVN